MIKPLRGYCLLEVEKAEEKTTTGIYLPERSQEKSAKGKVIEIGFENLEMLKRRWENSSSTTGLAGTFIEIKKDDIVYFKRWGGETIKEDGKEYVFVRFDDLLGIVE